MLTERQLMESPYVPTFGMFHCPPEGTLHSIPSLLSYEHSLE